MSSQIFYFALQTQTLRGEFQTYAVAVTDHARAAQLQADRVWKQITPAEFANIKAQRIHAQTTNVAQTLVAKARAQKEKQP